VTPAGGGALVLVVDDEPDVRRALRESLQREGYRVLEAGRVREALELARAHRPAVVTMDVFLPDVDGFEGIRLLRESADTRDIPVVVVSMTRRGDGALDSQVVGFLEKPVSEPLLLETIKSALVGRIANGAHVLVVDDDADIRTVLTRALGHAGFRATAAADGREALDAIAAAPPDLVLLDIRMPHVDGHELLRALRAEPATRELPVIVLTASQGGDGRESALAAGATAYLKKPFVADDLIGTIRGLLARGPGA